MRWSRAEVEAEPIAAPGRETRGGDKQARESRYPNCPTGDEPDVGSNPTASITYEVRNMIKKLTIDNWLEPEYIARFFVDMNGISMSGHDWANHILKPALSGNVPNDVKELFEVARGAMLYGYFFYPLYALADEQLSRVAEAAITHKCLELSPPKKLRFEEKIDWLAKQSVLTDEEKDYWHTIRKYRNEVSHPKFQKKLPPGAVLSLLNNFVEIINLLFK